MATRTGRRPGPSHTRGDILAAAARAFTTAGYEAASLRKIAAAAGVDPALIRRFFGSKEALFTAVAAAAIRPDEAISAVLDGPPERAGDRLARYYLRLLGEVRQPGPLLGVIRCAVTSEHAAALLRGFLAENILARIAAALGGDQPHLRAALTASQLAGLAVARYAVRLDPLVTASTSTLAAWIGPTLQAYLTAVAPPVRTQTPVTPGTEES